MPPPRDAGQQDDGFRGSDDNEQQPARRQATLEPAAQSSNATHQDESAHSLWAPPVAARSAADERNPFEPRQAPGAGQLPQRSPGIAGGPLSGPVGEFNGFTPARSAPSQPEGPRRIGGPFDRESDPFQRDSGAADRAGDPFQRENGAADRAGDPFQRENGSADRANDPFPRESRQFDRESGPADSQSSPVGRGPFERDGASFDQGGPGHNGGDQASTGRPPGVSAFGDQRVRVPGATLTGLPDGPASPEDGGALPARGGSSESGGFPVRGRAPEGASFPLRGGSQADGSPFGTDRQFAGDERSEDPFARQTDDAFAQQPGDPFARQSDDPFARPADGPFSRPGADAPRDAAEPAFGRTEGSRDEGDRPAGYPQRVPGASFNAPDAGRPPAPDSAPPGPADDRPNLAGGYPQRMPGASFGAAGAPVVADPVIAEPRSAASVPQPRDPADVADQSEPSGPAKGSARPVSASASVPVASRAPVEADEIPPPAPAPQSRVYGRAAPASEPAQDEDGSERAFGTRPGENPSDDDSMFGPRPTSGSAGTYGAAPAGTYGAASAGTYGGASADGPFGARPASGSPADGSAHPPFEGGRPGGFEPAPRPTSGGFGGHEGESGSDEQSGPDRFGPPPSRPGTYGTPSSGAASVSGGPAPMSDSPASVGRGPAPMGGGPASVSGGPAPMGGGLAAGGGPAPTSGGPKAAGRATASARVSPPGQPFAPPAPGSPAPGASQEGPDPAAFSEFTSDLAGRGRPGQPGHPGPVPGNPASRTTPPDYSEHTTDVSGRGHDQPEQPYVPAPALPTMHARPPLENGFPPPSAPPFGERPPAAPAFGEREPFGDRPAGGQPFGDRPAGGQPFGERPPSAPPFGEREPFGDRPAGGQPFGDRPGGQLFGERGERDQRGELGQRPPADATAQFGELLPDDPNQPFGARPRDGVVSRATVTPPPDPDRTASWPGTGGHDDQDRFNSFQPEIQPASDAAKPETPHVRMLPVLLGVILGAGLLVGLTFGITWLIARGSDSGGFAVSTGDCVKREGTEAVTAKCGDPGTFEVTSIVDTKEQCSDPGQPYVLNPTADNKTKVLCLKPRG
ncbi:LppU/SCO3897 family protein [Nucisporomicrobium flavum]|uniref:LppU/SCO3897 family protein n=1 Tax=Nucisporomicrobium flavum TaxID=2785915 RepID=UPI003C2D2F34